MVKLKKIVDQILGGRSDSNLAFKDICNLLTSLRFGIRIKGSHHIFRRADVEEKMNLQKESNKAKPYQVRQVRNIILKNKLGEELNE
jgi:predicted RNA binding protein YcfA (HicA-like mRNA interferase family)